MLKFNFLLFYPSWWINSKYCFQMKQQSERLQIIGRDQTLSKPGSKLINSSSRWSVKRSPQFPLQQQVWLTHQPERMNDLKLLSDSMNLCNCLFFCEINFYHRHPFVDQIVCQHSIFVTIYLIIYNLTHL